MLSQRSSAHGRIQALVTVILPMLVSQGGWESVSAGHWLLGRSGSGYLPASLVPQAGPGRRVLLIGVGSEVRSEVWVISGLWGVLNACVSGQWRSG